MLFISIRLYLPNLDAKKMYYLIQNAAGYYLHKYHLKGSDIFFTWINQERHAGYFFPNQIEIVLRYAAGQELTLIQINPNGQRRPIFVKGITAAAPEICLN